MVAISGTGNNASPFRRDWPVVTNGQELTRALLEATGLRCGIRVPVTICSPHPHGQPSCQWTPPLTFGCVWHQFDRVWLRYWSDWAQAARKSQDPAVLAIGERVWFAGQHWHFEYILLLANVPEYLADLLGEVVSA